VDYGGIVLEHMEHLKLRGGQASWDSWAREVAELEVSLAYQTAPSIPGPQAALHLVPEIRACLSAENSTSSRTACLAPEADMCPSSTMGKCTNARPSTGASNPIRAAMSRRAGDGIDQCYSLDDQEVNHSFVQPCRLSDLNS
jgi:hypothetical protein